jgi:membrane fusion protein
MGGSDKLFRSEAIDRPSERLHGEVLLTLPVSWQVVGLTLFAIVCVVFGFALAATYSRVETVQGVVTLDRGVASVSAHKAGVVSSVFVREGQHVVAGAPLVNVQVEADLMAGGSMSTEVARSIAQQDAGLSSQGDLVLRAAEAQQGKLAAQMVGMKREVAGFDEQIRAQQRLVEVAAQELKEVQTVAARGFISRRDVNLRETAVLTRKQQLAQLQQARAARLAEYNGASKDIAQVAASAQAQLAALRSSRSALSQQSTASDAGKGYMITAPVEGTVTALVARSGQHAEPGRPLLVILPSGARPEVELDIPSVAVGFLERGQEIRIAIDAFPYQRFGTISAQIASISSVTIPRVDANGTIRPVYIVRATLNEPTVLAVDRRHPLLPGMTLSARIITDRQTLIQWLFEPLFAVRSR